MENSFDGMLKLFKFQFCMEHIDMEFMATSTSNIPHEVQNISFPDQIHHRMILDLHFSELFMMWCNNANVIFVTGNHCAISDQFYPQHSFSISIS